MTKEQVYDEHLFPLMKQVIRVCQEHRIAMLATFALPSDDDPDLRCTTALLTDEYDPPKDLLRACYSVAKDAIRIDESEDGEG